MEMERHGLWPQWKRYYGPFMGYRPNRKGMVLWRLFFEVLIIMVKHKKDSIKDTMSIKISFTYYMKWARVMLPVVFKDFEVVYIFLLLLFFSLSLSIGKKVNFNKNLRGYNPQSSWFLRAWYVSNRYLPKISK